ncbi:unnamed protein product [Parajaminaea phylloscopi]
MADTISRAHASLRPTPPPKPSHLSVALTGTIDSATFRDYVKAQSTGGSFTSFNDGSENCHSRVSRPSGDGDQEEDDNDGVGLDTARPPALVTHKTPIQAIWPSEWLGEGIRTLDASDDSHHHRFASSASTVKGPRATPEDRSTCKATPHRWDQPNAEPIPTSLVDVLSEEEEEAAKLPQDREAKSIEGATVKVRIPSYVPSFTPESRDKHQAGLVSASPSTASELVPEPDRTDSCDRKRPAIALSRYSVASSSAGSPDVRERSRAPSILSARGSERFSKWEMQKIGACLMGSTPADASESSVVASEQSEYKVVANGSPGEATSEVPAMTQQAAHLVEQQASGKAARALFSFEGESSFNELSLAAGQTFQIISEELSGGWALAVVRDGGVSGGWRKGLVPQGWYIFEREMLPPPPPAIDDQATHRDEAYLAPVSVSASRVHVEVPPSAMRPGGEHLGHIAVEHQDSPSLNGNAGDSQRHARCTNVPGHHKQVSRATSALSQLVAPSSLSTRSNVMCRSASEATAVTPFRPDISHRGSADCRLTQASILPEPAKLEHAHQPPFPRSFARWSPFVATGAEEYLRSSKADGLVSLMASNNPVATSALARDGPKETSALTPVYTVELGANSEPRWKEVVQRFWSEVHSPHFVKPILGRGWLRSGAKEGFMTFFVTTRFIDPEQERCADPYDDHSKSAVHSGTSLGQPLPLDPALPPASPREVLTVSRRFRHFAHLATHLSVLYPLVPLPPLPSKSQSRRFEPDFIEDRRIALAHFIESVVRHPILRADPTLQSFLTVGAEAGRTPPSEGSWAQSVGLEHPASTKQEGEEWSEWILQHAAATSQDRSSDSKVRLPGTEFFARTIHPEFAVDAEEIDAEWNNAEVWLQEVEQRISKSTSSRPGTFLDSVKALREDTLKSSEALQSLGCSIAKLITDANDVPPNDSISRSKMRNEEGAWCWRPHCEPCRYLTMRLQNTSEAFLEVATLHEEQARFHLQAVHERVWSNSRPFSTSASLFEVNKETLRRYELARVADASAAGPSQLQSCSGEQSSSSAPCSAPLAVGAAEILASKAETVLNATGAELETLHEHKVEDWAKIGRDLLDEQIGLYEDALKRLREARQKWSTDGWASSDAAATAAKGEGPSGMGVSQTPISPRIAELVQSKRLAPKAPLRHPSRPLQHPSAFERSVLYPVGMAGDALIGALRHASGSYPGNGEGAYR